MNACKPHKFSEWPAVELFTLQFRTCVKCGHQQTRQPLLEGRFLMGNGRIVTKKA